MKSNYTKIKLSATRVALLLLVGVVLVGIGYKVDAYYGDSAKVVVEGNYIEASQPSGIESGYSTGPREETLGALASPDIMSWARVNGVFTYGKGVNATSTVVTTYTLVGADMADYHIIDLMINTGATSITLPATSTMMGMLQSPGMTREWIIHNATSTGVMTLVAGAGMDLVGIDANVDTLAAGSWGYLTCSQIYYRSGDNENILCDLREEINAD